MMKFLRMITYRRSDSVLFMALFIQFISLVTYYKVFVEKHREERADLRRDGDYNSGELTTSQRTRLELLKTTADWRTVPLRQRPSASELHDKWIVLTTINLPTEDVKKLAAIKGWKVVVVGDTKTPSEWSFPNCVFLDVEKQKSLGYNILNFLPYKNYARKNIGYLYAIEYGAKIIYETDDDNSPYEGIIQFFQQESGDFYTYKTQAPVVNPYAHFGQGSIWPRGYPLDHIADPPQQRFVNCKAVHPGIQQGVVDGDPDVDAIFRLTRKDQDVQLDIKFDSTAPPVMLPPRTMSPFNSQNTLFLYDAAWGMLLPVTVAFRVCDIWRGYWAQRLLWDVGGNLVFFPPNARQVRNAHNYHDDFIDEKQLYQESGKLVEFLINWKSDKKDFFDRVIDLSVAMVEKNFWGMDDALLTNAWLKDLVSLGYKQPSTTPMAQPCKEIIGNEIGLPPKEQPSSHLGAGSKLKLLTATAR